MKKYAGNKNKLQLPGEGEPAEMQAAGEEEAEPAVEPDQEENHRHLKPTLAYKNEKKMKVIIYKILLPVLMNEVKEE